MRSSKSRSRNNKPNRNRPNSVGNVVNRVFDSSGPEGKVRGTPQQIIEKYNQLARDAQLGNDRVAAENFQQHAEHYLRLLGEAQKEIEAKREQQEREQQERQSARDRDRAQDRAQDRSQGGGERPQGDGDPSNAPQPDTFADNDSGMGRGEEDGSTLVETPENAPKRAPRKPRRAVQQKGGDSAPAAEDTQPAPKARAPRKPKGDTVQRGSSDASSTDAAAE